MKILERIKEGLKKFNETLGEDIPDENEMDFPADIASDLIKSSDNVGQLEKAQEQLWESKPTRRSKLANELIVQEDGTIKQDIGRENPTIGQVSKSKRTRRPRNLNARENGEKQVEDSERVQ